MPVSLLACANTLGIEMSDIVDQQSLTDKTEAAVQPVQTALNSLKQLSATEINIELLNLNESLSAIKNFKLGKGRK